MRRFPRSQPGARLAFAVAIIGLGVAACAEGITEGRGRATPLNVVPSFQIDPSIPDAAPPVSRIRLRAISVATGAVLAMSDEDVDPSAAEWVLALEVETTEAIEVLVEVELLNGDEVVWSGRGGPFTIEPGGTAGARAVDVYRGPLDNLDVTGVAVSGVPAGLLSGTSVLLASEVSVAPGSTATPVLYWASSDTMRARVTAQGATATVTGVSAGDVSIFAVAGPVADTIRIGILPRVSSVVVTPAAFTLRAIDATQLLDAVVLDGFGLVDDLAAVTWTSANPAVATVDLTGLVTAVGAGTTQIAATSFEETGAATVTVLATDPGVDATWLGVTSDWGSASNWSTGAVPTAVDNVFIGGVGAAPVLDGTFEALSLDLADGALLTMQPLSRLTVHGDLVATGDVIGTQGSLTMAGSPATIDGWVSVDVSVTGDLTASGTTTLESVDVRGAGAVFRIGSSTTTIETSLSTSLGGVLAMTDPAGVVVVAGTTQFAGGSTAGYLTAGTMRVAGDFFAGDQDPRTFHASGSHTVVFEGGGVRSFQFSGPGPGAQQFHNVVFDRPVVINAMSDFVATGYVQLTSIATVDAAAYTVSVAGSLDDVTNGLTFDTLELIGPVTALPGSLPGNVVVGADVIWPAPDGVVDGSLAVDGSLTLLTNSLSVGADVSVAGALVVATGQALAITGTLTLDAGSILDVDGTVTATGGCVNAGATLTGIGTHPCAAAAAKTWLGGDPTDPTGWSVDANWSPAGVPTATDDVLVDVASGGPVLSGPAAVRSIGVGATSTLDLGGFVLSVTADLAADGAVTNGQVDVIGAGSILEGTLPTLRLAASRGASNPLAIAGDLRLENADLDVNGQTVQVSGDLMVTGGGAQLIMADPAGVLDVEGAALFDGGNAIGWLTDGTLRVAGDFTAASSSSTASFAAALAHVTELDGTGAQTVSFASPGATTQRFGSVTVSNTGGTVTLSSDLAAIGDVGIVAGAVVDGTGRTFSVAGSFVSSSDAVSLAELNVIGDLTALSTLVPADLRVSAGFNLPGDVFVAGDVRVVNADLLVGGNTLTIQDSLTIRGGAAQLRMEDAGGTVIVEGHALFDGGTTAGVMTAGVLTIAGDLTASATSSTASFAPTAGHETVLDGAGPQTVTFSNPGVTTQRFFDLLVQNVGAAVTFASDATVARDASFVDGSTVSGAGRVFQVGRSYGDPGLGATFAELDLIGAVTAITSPVPFDVRVSSTVTMSADLEVQGDLRVDNVDLLVGANTLTIADSLTVRGGAAQLRMESAASVVDVNGTALFDGGTSIGFLTDGTLSIAGDLVVNGTSTTAAFAGTANHETDFDGTGAQTASFTSPGATTQRFHHLTVSNTASTVTFDDGFTATGDVLFADGSSAVGTGRTFAVGGSYQDPGLGASFAELQAIGDLTAITSPLSADLTVTAVLNLPGSLSVTGDVRVVNTDLRVGVNTLTISDSLTVRGGAAQFRMEGSGSVVDVNGHALFDGGTSVGYLMQGQLRIAGDLTANATSSTTSFAASTAHSTIFDGTGDQTVTFSNPGATTQRFNGLVVSNTTGTVSFPVGFTALDQVLFFAGSTVSAPGQTFSVAVSYQDSGLGATFGELNVIGAVTSVTSPLPADLRVSVDWTLPAGLTVQGDVRLQNADLTVGANTLTVADSLTVRGGAAQLRMQTAGGVVDVNGSALFDGATSIGQLTNGTLRVAGDLVASATSSTTSFVGSSAHVTELDGTVDQTVTFSTPGTVTQRLQHLTVLNTDGVVSLGSSAVVMGDFLADAVALARTGALGTALEVRGLIDVTTMSMAGLPLRLVSGSTGDLHNLTDVSWTGMVGTQVQLYVELPGGVNFPLVVQDAVFQSQTFTTGAHVQTVRLSGSEDMVVQFIGGSPRPLTTIVGAGTLVEEF